MVRYSFSHRLKVGIPEIDTQHENIANMLHALACALSGGDAVTLAYRLEEIIAYTDDHFLDEEQFLARLGYIGLDEHRRQHAYLATQLRDLKEHLASDGALPGASLVDSLWLWFSSHVVKADRVAADWAYAKLPRHVRQPGTLLAK